MRAFNRVLSAFLAAVLVVAGVLTILEICRAALDQPPAVVQWPKLLPKLRNNSYNDVGPILVCVGLAIVGLLILISGIKRGKPYALPATSTAPGVRTEFHRRSLQRAMQAAVLATDRVAGGDVTLRRRSARITARASTHTIDGLDADIRQRVEALLSSIALIEPPRLKIKTYPAPAPPAPKSAARTPIGVAAAQVPPAATVGPEPRAEASPEPASSQDSAMWSPPPSPPVAKPESEPGPAPAPTIEFEPESTRETEPTEPRTAHLDDLLSDPEDGEPR